MKAYSPPKIIIKLRDTDFVHSLQKKKKKKKLEQKKHKKKQLFKVSATDSR